MNAGSNSAVLRTLVPRVWCFAYRLTEDLPLAEAMVANACTEGFDAETIVSEREAFVRMLAAAHSVLRNGNAFERYERARHASTGPSSLGTKKRIRSAEIPSRILAIFKALAPPERATLLLTEVEHLTYEESAEVLGVSVDRAKLAHVAVRLKIGRAFVDVDTRGALPLAQ
jgi:RNA polymerase sigma-70 factor (ECF subfamily)